MNDIESRAARGGKKRALNRVFQARLGAVRQSPQGRLGEKDNRPGKALSQGTAALELRGYLLKARRQFLFKSFLRPDFLLGLRRCLCNHRLGGGLGGCGRPRRLTRIRRGWSRSGLHWRRDTRHRRRDRRRRKWRSSFLFRSRRFSSGRSAACCAGAAGASGATCPLRKRDSKLLPKSVSL